MIRALVFLLSCSSFADTLGIVALCAFKWLWVSPLSSPSPMHWKTETYSVNHNFVC
jgi:hypothetical protein